MSTMTHAPAPGAGEREPGARFVPLPEEAVIAALVRLYQEARAAHPDADPETDPALFFGPTEVLEELRRQGWSHSARNTVSNRLRRFWLTEQPKVRSIVDPQSGATGLATGYRYAPLLAQGEQDVRGMVARAREQYDEAVRRYQARPADAAGRRKPSYMLQTRRAREGRNVLHEDVAGDLLNSFDAYVAASGRDRGDALDEALRLLLSQHRNQTSRAHRAVLSSLPSTGATP